MIWSLLISVSLASPLPKLYIDKAVVSNYETKSEILKDSLEELKIELRHIKQPVYQVVTLWHNGDREDRVLKKSDAERLLKHEIRLIEEMIEQKKHRYNP